jgi:carbon-monoxide dehydrogenase large subunit
VEVDPSLGTVEIRRLVAVDDYGVVVNPLLVQGQTLGSIVQGLGQALYESADYGPAGEPAARTLLDYLIPTAAEVPELVLEETVTQNPNQPFGAKGAGEAGCIGTPPAVLNAIADALHQADPGLGPGALVSSEGVQLPATPERVWRLCQRALAAPPG